LSLGVKSNNGYKMVEWRRNKVLQLTSQGLIQTEIADILHVSEPTVSRDLSYLRQRAKNNIKRYIDETLPEEYDRCLVGLTSILREAWITAAKTEDKREKLQALSLAKECYSMKLELLTNATVVDDAIRFVSEKQNSNLSKSKNQSSAAFESSEEEGSIVNQVY
jgi:hypothetical protein